MAAANPSVTERTNSPNESDLATEFNMKCALIAKFWATHSLNSRMFSNPSARQKRVTDAVETFARAAISVALAVMENCRSVSTTLATLRSKSRSDRIDL